jgi:endonuclease I
MKRSRGNANGVDVLPDGCDWATVEHLLVKASFTCFKTEDGQGPTEQKKRIMETDLHHCRTCGERINNRDRRNKRFAEDYKGNVRSFVPQDGRGEIARAVLYMMLVLFVCLLANSW